MNHNPAAVASRCREILPAVEFVSSDVVRVPLTTPTLPPATETNHYIVGTERAVLVDPSTPVRKLQRKLTQVVQELRRSGVELQALFLTHHHNDHAGAAAAMADQLDLPIWAHPLTAARLPHLKIARSIEHGEAVASSQDADWCAVFTPGHAPGHLVLHRQGGGMIAGDMVAGVGTILVDPLDGNMAQYLASLERMRALHPTFLGPAHGPVLRDPDAYLRHYRQHRLDRESKVFAALTAQAQRPDQLLGQVYGDVSRASWPVALRSLRSHLIHLGEQGLAREVGDRWTAVEPRPPVAESDSPS